ncbi:MAG: hypothetical protein DRQ98_13325, partial [Gammaproteobacteria bacterium]
DYKIDSEMMQKLFMLKGKEMGYPKIQNWPDTMPMSRVNDLTNGILVSTELYQRTMGLIMLGQMHEA